MAVLGLVVDRRPLLNDVPERGLIEDLAVARRAPHLLGQDQRRTTVAIGHPDHQFTRRRIERQRTILGHFGAIEKKPDGAVVERLEDQNAGARQQGRVQLE